MAGQGEGRGEEGRSQEGSRGRGREVRNGNAPSDLPTPPTVIFESIYKYSAFYMVLAAICIFSSDGAASATGSRAGVKGGHKIVSEWTVSSAYAHKLVLNSQELNWRLNEFH